MLWVTFNPAFFLHLIKILVNYQAIKQHVLTSQVSPLFIFLLKLLFKVTVTFNNLWPVRDKLTGLTTPVFTGVMGNTSNKKSGKVMGSDTTEKAGTFRIGFWTGSMQHYQINSMWLSHIPSPLPHTGFQPGSDCHNHILERAGPV